MFDRSYSITCCCCLAEYRCQFPTGEAGSNRLDGYDVVAVGTNLAVVDESGDTAGSPGLVNDRVQVVDLVRQIDAVDGEGNLEVAVDGSANYGQTTIMAVETRDGQDARVVGLVADGNGMPGLDGGVEARQDEAVSGIERHVEVHELLECLRADRATVLRNLVEGIEDVGRALGQDNSVVAVAHNLNTASEGYGVFCHAAHKVDVLQLGQTSGEVVHEAGGQLRAANHTEVSPAEVQEHAVGSSVLADAGAEGTGFVLVEADVHRERVSVQTMGSVDRSPRGFDDGGARRDAHERIIPFVVCRLARVGVGKQQLFRKPVRYIIIISLKLQICNTNKPPTVKYLALSIYNRCLYFRQILLE